MSVQTGPEQISRYWVDRFPAFHWVDRKLSCIPAIYCGLTLNEAAFLQLVWKLPHVHSSSEEAHCKSNENKTSGMC